MTEDRTPPKRENILLNIALNVIIPSILMSKGQKWYENYTEQPLEQKHWVFIIALAFPVGYGIYDFVARKKYNFFSILGFVSILITGAVGVFEFKKEWIAIKEAAVPAIFGVAALVSLKTPFPLVRTFLFNPDIFDVPKVQSTLAERGNEGAFEKLLVRCTLYLVASFALSAVLNFGLAKYVIRSETNTTEFAEEMGKMTALSWPVIAVPSTAVMMIALFALVKGIQKHTGFEIEDILLVDTQPKKDKKQAGDAPEPQAESSNEAPSDDDQET